MTKKLLIIPMMSCCNDGPAPRVLIAEMLMLIGRHSVGFGCKSAVYLVPLTQRESWTTVSVLLTEFESK